jgi:murein DD-endopeptidase MepM/ murein hydrolase activator NlpD
VDFIAPQNMPVLAAVDGEVLFISDNSNAGGLDLYIGINYLYYN